MQTNNRLRGALEKIVELTTPCEGVTSIELQVQDIAHAALAETRRNCDVGTAEEQAKRFFVFCDSNKCPSCPCRFTRKTDCALIWAQMPYEEGGEK